VSPSRPAENRQIAGVQQPRVKVIGILDFYPMGTHRKMCRLVGDENIVLSRVGSSG
jgi:hypothetical protein